MEARTYDSEFRKKMVTKMEGPEKRELIAVHKTLNNCGVEHPSNSNGFFYDVNGFSDECIVAIEAILTNRQVKSRFTPGVNNTVRGRFALPG
jgi:hypothetical protein